jgi:hypothetical protein
MFCTEKISTAMINSKLIMDLILCMDGYLAVSIPDSRAGFPEIDVRTVLDKRIMVGLNNGQSMALGPYSQQRRIPW